jgi:hypothetical protein
MTCVRVFLVTPTCHVSGYPRQVINADAAQTMLVYLVVLKQLYHTAIITLVLVYLRDDATSLVRLSS